LALEVAAIQLTPYPDQMLRGHWGGLAWFHSKGFTPILRALPLPAKAS
jgi:hypothetical protein